jgi:hypothetical protein
MSSSPSKLGRQPCWVACLLVCVPSSDACPDLYLLSQEKHSTRVGIVFPVIGYNSRQETEHLKKNKVGLVPFLYLNYIYFSMYFSRGRADRCRLSLLPGLGQDRSCRLSASDQRSPFRRRNSTAERSAAGPTAAAGEPPAAR